MPRSARIVFPGDPHHITHRSTNHMNIFISSSDFIKYKTILNQYCTRYSVHIWNYCVMNNHIHLIAVPKYKTSLSMAIGKAHEKYAAYAKQNHALKTESLWHGRFYSYPLDLSYYLHAARYVEQNPVRAGLVSLAEDWRWSSARHHIGLNNDSLIQRPDMSEFVDDWRAALRETLPEMDDLQRKHLSSGKPLQ